MCQRFTEIFHDVRTQGVAKVLSMEDLPDNWFRGLEPKLTLCDSNECVSAS